MVAAAAGAGAGAVAVHCVQAGVAAGLAVTVAEVFESLIIFLFLSQFYWLFLVNHLVLTQATCHRC